MILIVNLNLHFGHFAADAISCLNFFCILLFIDVLFINF